MRRYSNHVIFTFLLVFFIKLSPTEAQTGLEDTLSVPADTLRSDTLGLAADTASAKDQSEPLQGPIKYQADDIRLMEGGDHIVLKGNAKMTYQNMTLTAAHIKINRQYNTLYARGVVDSVDADSNLYYAGTPVFEEKGEEPLHGDFIEYNFKTRRGKIREGNTKMEPGYYKGEKINRIGEETMLVETGYFTSCEFIDDPHYYFKSDRMRVRIKDKVVAEPIYFYIADVPLFWLPFGVFPNKRGRHSGIVVPNYGENQYGGRFLRGMGYYWAPNDYFDATFLMDYYDRLGFTFRTDMRYTVRYKLKGSISAEYLPRDPYSGRRAERWRVRFNHNQTIDPTMSVSGSGSFSSDRQFARQLSPNIEDRLNQNVNSSLSLRKRWKGTKNSMTVNVTHNENLQNGRVEYTLPTLSFNRSQSNLYEFFSGENLGSKRNWYQNIYFSYNSRLIHRGSKVPATDSTFTTTEKSGVQHNLSFSAPQKILKYFNINPNVSYEENWVNEVTTARLNPETNTIETSAKPQFAALRTFNTGVGVKTTLYGLFEPNIGSLKFIRHKVDPSINFSYRPDFTSRFYGNMIYVEDTTGAVREVDRFQASPFGGTPRGRQQNMSIRIGNLFQGKVINDEGEERKLDLLNVDISTSRNFLADSLQWRPISTSLRTRIFGKNISLRLTHSLYKLSEDQSREIDAFASWPRLTSLSTGFGFSINNRTFQKKKEKDKEQQEARQDSLEKMQEEGILQNTGLQFEDRDYKEETKSINIPWSTNFNFTYSYRHARGEPRENFGLSARANLKLTKNWKISWNARFDLMERDISTQNFSIYRDLHCWEMSFSWQPQVGYYSFQINVKASALQDIKVTKHPSGSRYLPQY